MAESVWFPVVSKTKQPEIEGRYGLIPFPRAAVEDQRGGVVEVEVAARHEAAFPVADGEGRAGVEAVRGYRHGPVGESLGKEPDDVAADLGRVASAAALKKAFEAIVSPEFHVIDAFVEFLKG